VLTPLVEKQIRDLAEAKATSYEAAKKHLLEEKQPSLEFVTAEQIGETVVFLCSNAASQIRGACLNMDGGWLAQ
jgi:3-hydroxybutyrate dehydrogenase